MKLYSENDSYKLYQGNMLDMLDVIDKESIDSIVCDPPYELNFMSKGWDNAGVSFQADTWRKCYEVLKPGGYLLAFGGSRTFHRIACAIEDAGFEIRDTIMWLYGCLSNDTEILTSNGWKNSDTITIGDEIYSLDLEKDIIIRNKCLSVFKYDYDGEMVNLKNNNTNQLLTPNHHCIIKDKIKTQIKGKTKYNTHNYWNYKDAWQIRSQTVKLPLAGNYDGKLEIGNLFAELLGWIISEGTYLKDTNAIMITQSSINQKYVERIRYILGKLRIKYSEYSRERAYKNKTYTEYDFYIGKEAEKEVNKIKELIPNKKLNWNLLELSFTNKEFLIKGLLQGDGAKCDNTLGFSAFYQKDIEQLQVFQALLHLTGKQGWINENKYSCSIHNNPITELQGKHFKDRFVKYKGKYVWCIETEIGNFIAKRDGKIFITGNSGFPKSMDISKQIDKRPNRSYENLNLFGKKLKEQRELKGYSKNDIDKIMGTNTAYAWWEGRNYLGEFKIQLPDKENYKKLKEILELNDDMDFIFEEAEREVIGTKQSGCFNSQEKDRYTIGSSKSLEVDITIPSTDLAKKWQGWGTALKPSFEPIIVARKPFKGSLVDNVIEYGVGGINIDECRIGNEERVYKGMSKHKPEGAGTFRDDNWEPKDIEVNVEGRFPANTILTYDETDFDEVCGGFPINKSTLGPAYYKGNYTKNGWKNTSKQNTSEVIYNDSGSASRYFYCAKASKKDRDEGLPNKWLDNLELILYNNIGDELWKDKITIKEENKAKHLEDMAVSLKKVIEEYGIQKKKDIDLNMLLYGKKSLEKYLKENKYTTKTEINSITVSQILNLLTLYTTKENTRDVKLETENGINHVEIVENINQLEIIIKENQELVPGANNVVLKMLLKINEKEGRNEHCTVKPTNLMQYLVRLVTPNGGIVLDPFNGSGSTGKAVMYENKERNKNYKYIGIELTEEYLPIAKARIEYVCNLKEEKDMQMSIFDYLESKGE